MKNYSFEISAIIESSKWQKLSTIGGHKVYHLEGDAKVHTLLVMEAAEKMFGKGHFMVLVACLHDIGKIFTSVCHGPNDWTYPNHSNAGADHLAEFIPETMEEFSAIKWYVKYHIKPLFWIKSQNLTKDLEDIENTNPNKELCKLDWLRKLALCDIEGSKSVEPQTELIEFLEKLEL